MTRAEAHALIQREFPGCHYVIQAEEWGGDGHPETPVTGYSVFIYLTPRGDNRGNCGVHAMPSFSQAVNKAIDAAKAKRRELTQQSTPDDICAMFGEVAAPFCANLR